MSKFSLIFLLPLLLLKLNDVSASIELRPMSYEDIVAIDKPKLATVSSQGRIAFVIQKANKDKNFNSEIAYIYDAEKQVSQKIWEMDKIDQLVWKQDILYALGKKEDQYQILSLANQPLTLLSVPSPITAFVVDSLRSQIYYTQTKYLPEATVQKSKEEGYVYRWGKEHSLYVMGERRYGYPDVEEILSFDMSTGQSHHVTELPYKDWHLHDFLISDLQISEDGKDLAILANRTGHPELGESVGCREIWIWNVERQSLDKVERTAKTISNPLKIGNKTISFQKVDHNDLINAYVSEDVNNPPQVVVQKKDSEEVFHLTSLNKHLDFVSRGLVEPVTIATGDKLSVKGYLVHPVNKEEGKRYPLIIATYGFRGKSFIADAEWHSSFPAQVLANEGYFVLLMNHCGLAQNLVGNSNQAREIEGWNVLKVFERAVDVLNEKGLINPNQVGLYGWSHGAFIVQFIISHSKKFQAVCLGEGGDYGPSFFFLAGTDYAAKICDNIYGGPPWGETLKNYIEFSTLFNVQQIETPVLMEFVGGFTGVGALELYVPLRYLKIPAELVLYDGEEHNFVKPKARIASMARKVDWFNFWLLGKENFDKPEQNARWNEMKTIR
ncbi:Prolyl oligopeptidase family protein [Candidatus Rubidus massiliensis]|nr:Prolyl oligopeptidase family protein [Candidatus Rubidus massiliensis]